MKLCSLQANLSKPSKTASSNFLILSFIFIGSLLVPISEFVYAIAGFLFNKEALIASFDDNAFYYFKVAQNIARGFGSTFDGINLTNGYHHFQGVGIKKVVFVLIALFITFLARKRLEKVIGQDKFKDLSCLFLIFIASLALQLSYYYLLSTYIVWHWYRYFMIPIQIIASIFVLYYVISFGRVQRKLLSYALCFLCLTYVVRYSFYGNIQQFMTINTLLVI